MKHKSINQRLKTAKSLTVKQAILEKWALDWQFEQMMLIRNLEHAIRSNNYDQLCITTGQLKTVSQKKFEALPKIFGQIIGDE